MIANINKTKEILNYYGLQAKKKFGQNFLIDYNIIEKIVKTANIDKDTIVVEIGPGIGALTEALCMNAKKVYAFDIDSDMVNILKKELSFENLEIINKDFLDVNLYDYIDKCSKIKVVSNLPYYITTPLIFKLLNIDIVDEIYVMVQNEVASRIIGKPNTKEYGSLSVLIMYKASANYEFKVTRNCFYPAPNVDSAILSIKKIKNDYNVNNEPKFLKFIQNIFEMRRKTLVNNILNKYDINRNKIEDILVKNSFDINVRSESLTLDDIIKIYKDLEEFI